jgi:hypothetical protein
MSHIVHFFHPSSSVRFFVVKLPDFCCLVGSVFVMNRRCRRRVLRRGCHRRLPLRDNRVLCWLPPPPASASGGINSAAVTRLCLLPPPFLVVVVFGSHAPTELGSSATASAADSIDRRRLCCDSTDAWFDLHLSRLLGSIFPGRLDSVAQL